MASLKDDEAVRLILEKFHDAMVKHGLGDQLSHLNLLSGSTGSSNNSSASQESIEIAGFLRSQEWFFQLTRPGAERALMQKGIREGTYLVRPSSVKSSLVLSIRTKSAVVHGKVDFLKEGGCTIEGVHHFPHIVALINYYKENGEHLQTKLRQPLPRHPAAPSVAKFSEFEAKRSEIEKKGRLGGGNFGDVYRGRWKTMDVAIKQLNSKGQMSREEFMKEAKAMHKLQHERLVLLLAVCTDRDPIYIITEFMPNGSLEDYLRADQGTNLGIPELAKMASQISSGMAYLEEQKFVHRDLRTANILVGENNCVKITDFGLARPVTSGEDGQLVYTGMSMQFPWHWASPEIFMDRVFSTKSDVWSMGVLLYEMCTLCKKPLYPTDITNPHQLTTKLARNWRLPHPQHPNLQTPKEVYQVMRRCWFQEPEDRITFNELNEFFSKAAGKGSVKGRPSSVARDGSKKCVIS